MNCSFSEFPQINSSSSSVQISLHVVDGIKDFFFLPFKFKVGFLARVLRVSGFSAMDAWIWLLSDVRNSLLLINGARVGAEPKLPFFGVKVSGKLQLLVSIVTLQWKLDLAAMVVTHLSASHSPLCELNSSWNFCFLNNYDSWVWNIREIDFSLLSPIISDEDNALLVAIVSPEEIKDAVFDLAPDKSPGPDGFPPFFFQKYWTLVGNSVIILHVQIILELLVFVPIYKIISKVITNHLKLVLGKIIHPLQGAFVPERAIQDNILIAHEVFHSFSKKSGYEGWIVVKLNMEKAYDRLEWNYILVTLRKLGFCSQWVEWIKCCISTPSFSVLVNGIPSDRFIPSRGIRQGDPLSPYLFILCSELLARQLSAAIAQNDKPIGVSKGKSGVRIPFLTFADDTMIFARASEVSCSTIKRILDKYCSMSGQLVNFHKSAFQCSPNVLDYSKINFASMLGMTEVDNLGEYLGCPIIDSRVTKETFGKVCCKVVSQLPKWKANSLSQAGRTVLIQDNLATKANYQMQNFYLLKPILSSLDKSYRNFFWNKDNLNKTANLIGWDKICLPKQYGGLGIRKVDVNNVALQMKLLWKLIKLKDNLWVNLVKKKYIKFQDILTHKVSSVASWQWKKLMSIWPLFKKGLRWQVGNGRDISFWDDNWVFQYPIRMVVSPLPGPENFRVSDLMDEFGGWDRIKIGLLVPSHIVSRICSYYLPSSSQKDSLVWGLTADGEYSVKTGSLLAQGVFNPNFEKVEFAWLWKLQVPPKIKMFLWKACHDGLPSKDRLEKCKVFIPQQCVLCCNALESISHLCFQSPFTLEVFACLQFIRNKVIFNDEGFSPHRVSYMISSFFAQRSKSAAEGGNDIIIPSPTIIRPFPKVARAGPNLVWSPPPANLCKLNFDGSKDSISNAALGFVIRNSSGEVLLAGAKSLGPHISIVQAEAWALSEGVKGAISLDISHIIIEGDNLIVINSMKNSWRIPWEIYNIVKLKMQVYILDVWKLKRHVKCLRRRIVALRQPLCREKSLLKSAFYELILDHHATKHCKHRQKV
ncbi:uncharacterized protein LOC130591430 [Beta vulgaris subsp. vulgaris]|uniref:uncharacterized protein LOC130591430 n=1 Tax=Beta vulgaris subsp. vulgaris TaxID=3555 RepID=UPI002547D9DF|nr:uncharacterized protein LOC130591430 [Beta vulgaris subsp. vulgaris]